MRHSLSKSAVQNGVEKMIQVSACTICAELCDEKELNLFRGFCEDSKYESRIVDETENFVALPALGQIVEGYMLVVSRAHFLSFGAVLKDHSREEELIALIQKVQNRLEQVYGHKGIIFEHGPASPTRRAGCCTDHAHLHLVPVGVDLMELLATDPLPWVTIESLSGLTECVKRGDAYLFYQNELGIRYLCVANHGVPLQYLRKVLACMVGRPSEWDWRVYPNQERLQTALERYLSAAEVGPRPL